VTSVFHGPVPTMVVFKTSGDEIQALADWLNKTVQDGIRDETIAILVRSNAEVPRAVSARDQSEHIGIQIDLMQDAKGMEFRAVAVMACDADVLPSEERLLGATDDRELREIFDTERHLLYVAATRAREHLWLSAVEPASEFLEDLMS